MLCLLIARGVGSAGGGELDKISEDGLVTIVNGFVEDLPVPTD